MINEGRVEQVGTPDQLYDEPANDFVMRFIGPVTRLGDRLVRPHDVEVVDAGSPGVTGTVSRIARVGFEVRVEVAAGDQIVLATMSRVDLRHLGLHEGDTVRLSVSDDAVTVPFPTTR